MDGHIDFSKLRQSMALVIAKSYSMQVPWFTKPTAGSIIIIDFLIAIMKALACKFSPYW